MSNEERKLHFALMKLTRGFTHVDLFAYRKERNWEKYDQASREERLLMIIKEIRAYKKGYIEEDNNYNERDYRSSTDEWTTT